MTALTHGADPEALDALATEMLHTAERLALIGRYHLDALGTLAWSGPDADRARQQWAYVWLAAIRPTSMALAEAAGHAREHARQQRDVSEGGMGVSAPSGTSPGTPAAPASPPTDGGAPGVVTVERVLSLLQEGPELATIVTAARTWENGLDLATYPLASSVLNGASGLTRVGGAFLTTAGLGVNGVETYQALHDGDYAGAVIPGTGLAIGVAGLAGAPLAAPIGAAWGVGSVVGDAASDAMQGTDYGDAFDARMSRAFDSMGVAGVLMTPGNLAMAGWDMLVGEDVDGNPLRDDD